MKANKSRKTKAIGREAYSSVSWFVAGMGTILSVLPVSAMSRNCETITTTQRLGNVTHRVGAYFDTVRQRESLKDGKEATASRTP